MASFTFIGDPRGHPNPEHVELFGIRFRLGEAVEVDDAMVIAKLAAHSHFARNDARAEVVEDEEPAPKRRGRPRKDKDVSDNG